MKVGVVEYSQSEPQEPTARPPASARSRSASSRGSAQTSEDLGVTWMQRFQGGDEASFAQLVSHYQSGVFHFIRSTLRDEGRAEDLAQEVFLRVYRARSRYQPTARFKTWLFTIANRLVLNEIRALRRRRRVFADLSINEARTTDENESSLASAVASDDETPREFAERKELDQFMTELINQLPASQRAAIELQRTERFSYAEIADILSVSPMAVKSLLVRAREKLKVGLEHYLSGRKSQE